MVIHDYKAQYKNLLSSCIATVVLTVCLGAMTIAVSPAAITAAAIIAATVIGDPNKYCNICGESLTTLSGKNTKANVITIGTPIT